MSNTNLGHYYGPAPSDAELGIGNTRPEPLCYCGAAKEDFVHKSRHQYEPKEQ